MITYFVFLALARWVAGAVIPATYKFQSPLNINGKVLLKWSISEGDSVVFQVEAETKGYVGIGFSSNGAMRGADIVLLYHDQDDQPIIKDMYATGNAKPYLDESQDYILETGRKNETHQIYTFSRKWNTCDERDMVFTEATMSIIWAKSNNVPQESDNDVQFDYHGEHRGSKSLFLNSSNSIDSKALIGSKTLDIPIESASRLPGQVTDYNCLILNFPVLSEKHHIIGMSMEVSKEYALHVHHVVIYECPVSQNEYFANALETFAKEKHNPECFGPTTPDAFHLCQNAILGWAVGSEGFLIPDHVGIPLEANQKYFYRVESHFDYTYEPEGIPNAVVRIHYTDNLRKYDGASLMLAASYSDQIIIPPRQNEWIINAECSQECLGPGIEATEEKKINLYGVMHHTHLFGTKVEMRHIRNGQELDLASEDPNYDFNYQNILLLKEEREVLPDDTIIASCTYNSSRSKVPIYGGLGTEEEMCLIVVYYYPKIDVAACNTRPRPEHLADSFSLQISGSGQSFKTNIIVDEQEIDMRTYANENAENIFTDENIEKYKKLVDEDKFKISTCTRGLPVDAGTNGEQLVEKLNDPGIIMDLPMMKMFDHLFEMPEYKKMERKNICKK